MIQRISNFINDAVAVAVVSAPKLLFKTRNIVCLMMNHETEEYDIQLK